MINASGKTSFTQHILIANTKGLYPTSSRAIATMFESQVPTEKLDKLTLVLYKVTVIKKLYLYVQRCCIQNIHAAGDDESFLQNGLATKGVKPNPAGKYMLKVNYRNSRKWCEICSNLTIKTPRRCQWY